MNNTSPTLWFVYDGECPICNIAAQGLRIRKAVGNLQLLDARKERGHPVMQELCEKQLNLDQGMVIKWGETCYQGKDALYIMALLGSNTGWFNRMNALLFRSKIAAAFCYPMMKATRNFLLWIKQVPPIRNIE